MSAQYIRDHYQVPAERGGRLTFDARRTGIIVGFRDGYLRVRFDDTPHHVVTLHPTWRVQYEGGDPA